MTTILLHTARAFTPTTEIPDAGILIRDGVIEAIGPRQGMSLPAGAQEVLATQQTAVPGFVDVHIHGAGGHDVMEGTEEGMSCRRAHRRAPRHDFLCGYDGDRQPRRHLSEAWKALRDSSQRSTKPMSHAPKSWGFTTKGRSSARRGAACIRRSGSNCLRRSCWTGFCTQLPATPAFLTIAPELLGAAPCIDAAHKAGVVVAMGHTDATYEQARAAHRARGAPRRPCVQRDAAVLAPRQRRDRRGAHFAGRHRGADRRRRARRRSGDAPAPASEGRRTA